MQPYPNLADLPAPRNARAGWPSTIDGSGVPNAPSVGSRLPTISIVTPSYNQGDFIEETIRSVLLQNYPNLEYIVIDGGSVDGSVEIIRRYAPWLSFWCSEPDQGQSDAINKGLRIASGVIVAWLNSDDVLTPGALHKVARCFAAAEGPAVVCGAAEIRSQDLSSVLWKFGDPPTTTETIYAYAEGRQIGQPSVFMSRALLDFPEPVRRDLHYVMDFELWLRLSQKCDFIGLPETLSWMRHHDGAKTIRDNHRIYEELEPVMRAYRHAVPPRRASALIQACRRNRARAYLTDALQPIRAADRQKAIRRALAALRIDPSVLLSRPFYSVLGRICGTGGAAT